MLRAAVEPVPVVREHPFHRPRAAFRAGEHPGPVEEPDQDGVARALRHGVVEALHGVQQRVEVLLDGPASASRCLMTTSRSSASSRTASSASS
ncbi:hypothetical protein L6E10_32360 [Lentzea sp. CC55]|nr:hypothetical protein [Lentzea sp. CC55]MCG8927098.1 hypothetical protein [Lentzea sp. CC55]